MKIIFFIVLLTTLSSCNLPLMCGPLSRIRNYLQENYDVIPSNNEQSGILHFSKGDRTDSEYPVYVCFGIMDDFSTFKDAMSKAVDSNGGDPVYGRYIPMHAKGGKASEDLGFIVDIFREKFGRFRYESPISDFTFIDLMCVDLKYLMSLDQYKDKKILILAHSESHILVDNCLTYFSEEDRDRIQVLSIVPAKRIFARKVHTIRTYFSRDIVPLTDPDGLSRNGEVITYLPPAGGDEMTPSFTSPIYDEKIEIELKKFKGIE